MDDLLDDIVRAARRCERAARQFEAERVCTIRDRLGEAIQQIGRAWSGSWIGYHSRVYTDGLRPRLPGESFDSEWGADGGFNDTTRGAWAEYDPNDVEQALMKLAGVTDDDWAYLEQLANAAEESFESAQTEMLPILDAILVEHDEAPIREARKKVAELKCSVSRTEIVRALMPKQWMSRDSRAMNEGPQVPPHVHVQIRLGEQLFFGTQAAALAKQARYAVSYLEKRHKMKGKTVAKTDGKVFIGHGRSAVWRDLKDFVQDRLRLQWDEFNREPTAGKSTKERLEEMLDSACFAFLVMTGEDERADGTKQARANVIHEAGLFQGRLGFERAVVLLEDGCEEFSNITGITQIRFPVGNVSAKFEEIRRVLERENIIR
jgi:predicted nucleotide-binding protein